MIQVAPHSANVLDTDTDRPTSLLNSHAKTEPKGHRLVPLLVWLGVILTLLLIPLRIISYGYLPGDDGLRHAAKAVTDREWSDIIVMQDEFKMDHNPGWHWILGAVHRITGADQEALVAFAVCILAFAVILPPLGWLRYPEAWAASLLLSQLVFPNLIYRTFLARPLAFSAAVTIVILLLWRKRVNEKPPYWLLGVSTLLFALASWIHGSWYLFALLVGAFAFAGQWRTSIWLGGCWLVGAFGGALLTGHPLAFLWNAINIGISCFGKYQLPRMLVGEFRASEGEAPALLFIAVLLITRAVSGHWTWKAVYNPMFILIALGWICGLRVIRFWIDWALPALAIWTALELQEHFSRHLNFSSYRRLVIAGALCIALFFALTSDLKSRWTDNLSTEYLSQSDPEMAPWLPEEGGIIYNSFMGVFYDTFYKNPHAKWKYILGFESTFMPPDDLRILQNIKWNFYAAKAHEPWVAKMRPQDRMIFKSGASTPPNISGLEWKYVARETWIGRLPRTNVTAVPTPAK